MKVVTLNESVGLGRLVVSEKADPGAPGPGQIRVRIHGTSLNFHDYGVISGQPARSIGRVPMSDGSGIVEATGFGVLDFQVGDRVVSTFFPQWIDGAASHGDFSTVPGDGTDGYASEVVLRSATSFTVAPREWTFTEAATLTTAGLTAWRSLVEEGGLKAGDTVLILGTGGVAMFSLQIAKRLGAIVIVTSSSDEKLERVRSLGADFGINYRRDEQWAKEVRRITAGRGVDHVIETGGAATLPKSIDATRVAGQISLIGTVAGSSGEIPTAQLMRKQIRLQGLIVGCRRQQQDMVRAFDAFRIRPIVDTTFQGLENLPDAFRYQELREHVGKICLSL